MTVNKANASIIILTHNGLKDNTIPCLNSIFMNSHDPGIEVIIVDNGSNDNTVGYLQELQEKHTNLRCVIKDKNEGYARGNNEGISAATGDYLILLNNDTIVTRGWLDKLLTPLKEDENIGLIGPVTNSVGNEQRIYTLGETVEQILAEGSAWCDFSNGKNFETELLGFFCVAMPRSLINSIGLLDESFGIGFYEDDDFCIRVKKAGYKLVCREDVFIYHRGSATFQYNSAKSNRTLMKSNKKRLEQKTGFKYNPAHPRDQILRLILRDLKTAEEFNNFSEIYPRIENRMKLLGTMHPRGLLKRINFNRKLKAAMGKIKEMSHGDLPD
ncbi:glycosyltransferase family 2 protein [Deltaproteobacteria bacterium]|nr:glycosyltransferase family 2 protein [Deltaproteobacteria bacterium]